MFVYALAQGTSRDPQSFWSVPMLSAGMDAGLFYRGVNFIKQ